MPYPLVLKVVLVMLFLYGIIASISKINEHKHDSSGYKISSYISLAVYFVFLPNVPKGVDRLLSMPKDQLTGIGVGLFIFLCLERVVQSASWTLGNMLEGPTDFIFQKIVQALPKTSTSIPEPEEILFSEDMRIAAIHEAGHALMFGVLDTILSSLYAFINKRALCSSKSFTLGGQVAAKSKPHSFQYKTSMEWQMLLSLAGMEGEKALLGVCSSGGLSDMEHYYSKAQLYLASGCSALLYFPVPEKDWEIKTNKESLELLLENQRGLLVQFFKENRQILSELADTLILKERLKAHDLKPFLDKVVSVPGMPQLKEEHSRLI
jgi:hypothetical protein